MSRVVDARGLNCPEPVILTKRAMAENQGTELTTIVNNDAALENVSKLARSQGYNLEVETRGEDHYLHMTPNEGAVATENKNDIKVAILIKSSLFGQGEPELGQILMKSFLFSLNELEDQIGHLIFMNTGVQLTTSSSPVLEYLQSLEQKGVEILSCGTCLDYYQVKDQLAVGKVTNMYSAVEIMTGADRVITI